MSRTLALHVGTHKTGTKTIQTFLSVNRSPLAEAGIYYPRAARVQFSPGAFSPGHHAFAWEIAGGEHSAEIRALVAEVAEAPQPLAVVSSEDLSPLYAVPGSFEHIRDIFSQAGIAVVPILYVRRQDEFAQSLYGEYAKASFVRPFDAFIAQIIAEGAYHPESAAPWIAFEYSLLTTALEGAFGTRRPIVRAFDIGADPLALVKDFLNVLALLHGPLTLTGLQNPLPRANERATLRALLESIRTALHGNNFPQAPDEILDLPFRVLTYRDSARLLERFGTGNQELAQRFGLRLPFCDQSDIRSEDDAAWTLAERHRAILSEAFVMWR